MDVNCRWICLESLLLHSKLQSWGLQWLLWFSRLLLPWRIHYTTWSSTALWSVQRPWRESPTDSRNWEPFLRNPQGRTPSSRKPHQIPACCSKPAVMGQPSLEAMAPALLLISLSVLLLWLWVRRESTGGALRINKLQFPFRNWTRGVRVSDLNLRYKPSEGFVVLEEDQSSNTYCSRKEFQSENVPREGGQDTPFLTLSHSMKDMLLSNLHMGRLVSIFCGR